MEAIGLFGLMEAEIRDGGRLDLRREIIEFGEY